MMVTVSNLSTEDKLQDARSWSTRGVILQQTIILWEFLMRKYCTPEWEDWNDGDTIARFESWVVLRAWRWRTWILIPYLTLRCCCFWLSFEIQTVSSLYPSSSPLNYTTFMVFQLRSLSQLDDILHDIHLYKTEFTSAYNYMHSFSAEGNGGREARDNIVKPLRNNVCLGWWWRTPPSLCCCLYAHILKEIQSSSPLPVTSPTSSADSLLLQSHETITESLLKIEIHFGGVSVPGQKARACCLNCVVLTPMSKGKCLIWPYSTSDVNTLNVPMSISLNTWQETASTYTSAKLTIRKNNFFKTWHLINDVPKVSTLLLWDGDIVVTETFNQFGNR